MKALLLVSGLILGGADALAQGTVVFNNRVLGVVVTHVYLPSAAHPGVVQIGNGPDDTPAGTTDWTGWSLVSGAGFSAQLFAANGAGVPADSLAPAFPITAFRTTDTGAGFIVGTTATLTGVPYFALATIQMRVWDNQGGIITSWEAAVAQPAGTELVGTSAPFKVLLNGPLQPDPSLMGLQSFSLYYVPEPAPFALAGFGFLLWLICSTQRRDVPREPL